MQQQPFDSTSINLPEEEPRPKGYVDSGYLQTTDDLLQHFKQRSYELMRIKAGHNVLDVGCGPASDTIALAELVGSNGQVIGVDYDPQMIIEADARARQAGVSAWVSHKQSLTDALPFESNSFHSCRSERVFQHLHNPRQALTEMVRVTKPGGRVVIWDADWGTLSIDTDDVAVERQLARSMADRNVNNGYSGRRLYRLFKQQLLGVTMFEANTLFFTSYPLMRTVIGLDYVEQDALSTNAITPEELARWRANLEQADREGWFFASVTGILIAGEKLA